MAESAKYERGLGAAGSYTELKRAGLEAVATVRIYGIPLEDAVTFEGGTAIAWCGFAAGGERELRQGTDRIWHLAGSAIQHREAVEGFVHDGEQVEAFTVPADYVPIEETYVPVRVDGGVVTAEARRIGSRFRWPGTVMDAPVTLDPGGPASPGPGQPPTTLDPGQPPGGPGQPPTTLIP